MEKSDLKYKEPTTKNDCDTCIHNKGVLECDMYGCKYEPTAKNDLGVDWESYKDVDGNSLDDLILEVLQNNFDCGNTYGYKVADEIIELLPSVTPQEPQSFKWCTDCKEYDQEKHCCHRWSKVIRDTVEEMKEEQEPKTRHWIPLGYEDEWWGEVCTCSECGSSMFRSNYCPNCGAKMIEPQERENE